jgi:Peptidase family M23
LSATGTPPPPRDAPGTTQTLDLPIYVMTVRQLRQLRILVGVLVGVIAVLVTVLGILLPRALAYHDLFKEDLDLRTRITEIDRKMADVDKVMLRLRVYDAQIKSLGGVTGDHGGAEPQDGTDVVPEGDEPPGEEPPEPAPTAAPTDASPSGASNVPLPHPDFLDPDLQGAAGEVDPEELRPADAWASAVEGRIEAFLAMVSLTEPHLNEAVRELEDLRALDQALPNLWPTDGRITSGFGWRRSPFGHAWRFHSGLDIATIRGTPIYAAAAGKVMLAGYNSGYGRMVEIDHGFGISTLYGHCNTLEVRPGQHVEPGDLIATVGSTGRSTGPHLHFEVRLDGHPVDPLDYLPR